MKGGSLQKITMCIAFFMSSAFYTFGCHLHLVTFLSLFVIDATISLPYHHSNCHHFGAFTMKADC